MSSRRGFTLIELLVVVAIIAVLIALLVPAVQKVRESAARTQCQNHVRQLGIAAQTHHDTHRKLPPGGSTAGNLSYVCYLLPYLEQEPLYRSMNRKVHFNQAPNNEYLPLKVPLLQCPSSTQALSGVLGIETYMGQAAATLHYMGNMGPLGGIYPSNSSLQGGFASGGVLYRNSAVKLAGIRDGTSNTILLGEMSWTQPEATSGYRAWSRGCGTEDCVSCRNIVSGFRQTAYNGLDNFNNVSLGSNHPGGTNLAFCDGSVRFVRDDISPQILMNAASREAGDLPNLDE